MTFITRQSKIRTKARRITDIAIQKVPLVNFDGLTNAENEVIREYHQMLLHTTQKRIELCGDDMIENAIVVDLHDYSFLLIEGERGMVDISKNRDAHIMIRGSYKNTLLYMHNHPSTGTFSANDVKMFIKNKSIFIMTAVGNDGTVYVIQKDNDFDGDSLLLDYINTCMELEKSGVRYCATEAIKVILKNACQYGLIYKIGGHGK